MTLETWTKRVMCQITKIDPVRYDLPCGIVKLIPRGVELSPKGIFPIGGFSSTSLAVLMRNLLPWFALIGSVLLIGGCGLLQTRDPEDPSDPGSSFVPPTSSDIVMVNLQAAVRERNAQNYRRCLVDTNFTERSFTFEPSVEAAAQHAAVFAQWSLALEEQYFRNLSESKSDGIARLDFFNIATNLLSVDEVVFTAKYHLVFQHQNSSIGQEARGNLQFYIARDQRSWWTIYRWVDSRDTANVTWSDLKAIFR